MRGALLIALGACYAPSVVPGTPCDPAINNCPPGVECLPDGTGYTCGGGSPIVVDVAVDTPDGAGDADLDADGVLDAVDNCPARANSNQNDEDADELGDVCDPCPVSAENIDTDGDGVANDCDPRPGMTGDVIVLFEPFAGGTPAGWNLGVGATISNGSLRFTTGAGEVHGVRTSVAATPRMTVAASMVADQVNAAVGSIGMMNPYATAQGGGGVMCSLFQSGPASRFLSIYDIGADVVIDNDVRAWTTGTPYLVVFSRTDNHYVCADENGESPSGTRATNIVNPLVGLRSDAVAGRFQWLIAIQSP